MRINLRLILVLLPFLFYEKSAFCQDTINNIPEFKSTSVYDLNGKLYKKVVSIDSSNQKIKYYNEDGIEMGNIYIKPHIDSCTSQYINNTLGQILNKKNCFYHYIFFSFIISDSSISNIRLIDQNYKNYSNKELIDLITSSLKTLKCPKTNSCEALIEYYYSCYTECAIPREKKSEGYKPKQ